MAFARLTLDEIQRQGEQLGPEGLKRSQEDWAELIAQVRAERDKGTDPAAPEVQTLARRWMALVDAFTGGDAEIESFLGRLWKE